MIPKLHRVVTFYNPRRPTGIESSKLAQEAAQQMALQLVERHVASADELQASLRALRAGEVDAYLRGVRPAGEQRSPIDHRYSKGQKIADYVRLPKFMSPKGGSTATP